jgi:lipopolysaccharide transport system ATP-binding protein
MSDLALRVTGLGKRYWLGGPRPQRTFREAFMDALQAPLRWLRPPAATEVGQSTFWALRDVSFEVPRGEVLGIIGANGAGKSTLLKVLSRITEPTQGEADLYGRVGSLLEVGTGFHSELTGRENIFLNGAILGMGRTEIRRKFEEIVAFAEVQKFIDTPVKHYSSGMYMRLAFAVAAHLEPEILIVDEVLAVGDIAFQKKCLSKMEEVSRVGRTVLFVSHNMQAIRQLCGRCLLLSRGQVTRDGKPGDVVAAYYKDLREVDVQADTAVHNPRFRRGTGAARFTTIQIHDKSGQSRFEFSMGETIRLTLAYETFARLKNLYVAVNLKTVVSNEVITGVRFPVCAGEVPAGQQGEIVVDLPDANLRPGEYPVYFWLGDAESHAFDVVDGLSAPLMISTDKGPNELGFDPSYPSGYFSIPARVHCQQVFNSGATPVR